MNPQLKSRVAQKMQGTPQQAQVSSLSQNPITSGISNIASNVGRGAQGVGQILGNVSSQIGSGISNTISNIAQKMGTGFGSNNQPSNNQLQLDPSTLPPVLSSQESQAQRQGSVDQSYNSATSQSNQPTPPYLNYLITNKDGSKNFSRYTIPQGTDKYGPSSDFDRQLRLGETYTGPNGSGVNSQGFVLLNPSDPLYNEFPEAIPNSATGDMLGRFNEEGLGTGGLGQNFKNQRQPYPITPDILKQANMVYSTSTPATTDEPAHVKGDLVNPELKQWIDYVNANATNATPVSRYTNSNY